MDETRPDQPSQLKLAVAQGLTTLAFGVIGTAAFWLSGYQDMVPITLLITGAGLLTLTAAGLVWIRRRNHRRLMDENPYKTPQETRKHSWLIPLLVYIAVLGIHYRPGTANAPRFWSAGGISWRP